MRRSLTTHVYHILRDRIEQRAMSHIWKKNDCAASCLHREFTPRGEVKT